MEPATETIEDRIRERAYHLWEANGRPPGRDEEFWHQACETIATPVEQPEPQLKQRKPRQRRARK